MSKNNTAYIILGSNINPNYNINQGLAYISKALPIIHVSPTIITQPIGDNISKKIFHNTAIGVQTSLSIPSIKHEILRPIESRLGRVRTSNPNSDRVFDADICLFNNDSCNDDGIIIPDPDLFHYPFISYLLSLLIPKYTIPGDGRSIQELSDTLNKDILPYEHISNTDQKIQNINQEAINS